VFPFRRGAWLRLYGIPIHAWNGNFFKLCVMDCGSYLRSDEMTLDRGRLCSRPDCDTIIGGRFLC